MFLFPVASCKYCAMESSCMLYTDSPPPPLCWVPCAVSGQPPQHIGTFGRTVNHAKSHKVKVHACHPTLKLHRPCIDLKVPPHDKRHSKCSLAQQLSQARVHFGRISTTFIHYHTKWSNSVTKNILLSQICLIHDLQ